VVSIDLCESRGLLKLARTLGVELDNGLEPFPEARHQSRGTPIPARTDGATQHDTSR
jgi:hypothetical protein